MTNMTQEELVRRELESLSDGKFQKFSSGLIPGCTNLLGVKIPEIRKIAKRMAADDPFLYLHSTDEIYFEEVMLKGLIIGNLKTDIESALREAEYFIPKITNWSLCDSFCAEFKIARKNRNRVREFLEPYFYSENEFEVRMAIVMMLDHYMKEEYLADMFGTFDRLTHNGYYVNMAAAWALSICYIHFPEQTMPYLKQNLLNDFTFNKTLQKIMESFRVSDEAKREIRNMKRTGDKDGKIDLF